MCSQLNSFQPDPFLFLFLQLPCGGTFAPVPEGKRGAVYLLEQGSLVAIDAATGAKRGGSGWKGGGGGGGPISRRMEEGAVLGRVVGLPVHGFKCSDPHGCFLLRVHLQQATTRSARSATPTAAAGTT